MHVFITGFMGSGKTYWGRRMSMETGLPHIDTDAWIENKLGMSVTEIFNRYDEAYFREQETACIREIALMKQRHLVSCGGGITCNSNNLRILKKSGVVIFINVTIDLVIARLRLENSSRPLLSDGPKEELEFRIRRLYEERKPCFEGYDKMFDAESLNPATFAEYILSYA